MSELQGPRIPGEERSARRRPLGWIVGGLLALLLLALLIPFACQAFTSGGGSDSQGQGSGTQGKAVAQEADDGGGGGGGATNADGAKNTGNPGGGAEENAQANAQAEPAGSEGSQQDGKDTAAEADGGGGGVGSGAEEVEKTPSERGDPRSGGGGELPDTGGMSPTALLFVGTLLLMIVGTTGLWAVVVRRGSAASRG